MQTINANNPFLSYKMAIQIALGGKGAGRPVFKERGVDSITLVDDVDEYQFIFDDLNYSYVEDLPMQDISVFTIEDFGKFFYEYGRTILANLSICLTKADWNSVALDSNGMAKYVADYYNQLIKLDDKVEDVIKTFKEVAVDESDSDYSPFKMNYLAASDMIDDYKSVVQASKKSEDMKNTEIFYVAYIGLMFTLYGVFILFSQISDEFDLFSFMKSPKSQSFLSIYEKILKEAALGQQEKAHILTLVYAYYKMTEFYKRTSGFEKLDPFAGTMFDIAEVFVSKITGSDGEQAKTIISLLDNDLNNASFASGISLNTFTDRCDPLSDFLYFKTAVIIEKDNPNIFDFGFVYLTTYELESESEEEKLYSAKYLKPAIKTYIEGTLKAQYNNDDVERAFGVVKNLLTGVEDTDRFSDVEPGFILQLVILASAFRIIHNRSTQRSNKAANEINAAIDILDVMILKLYKIWFESNKFYIQPNRPNYCLGREGINTTLHELKEETLDILKYYFEFVRYGIGNISDSDKTMYESFKNECLTQLYTNKNEQAVAKFLNNQFAFGDSETFIRCCATKNGKTFAQFAILDGDKTFESLVKAYSNKEIPKYIITNLSREPETHTGINPMDRVVDCAAEAKQVTEKPEVYLIVVYATYYYIFDTILRKFNTGNYFDFGNAENSLGSYFIENTVGRLVGAPLKKAVAYNSL